jgi:hypothetical protein
MTYIVWAMYGSKEIDSLRGIKVMTGVNYWVFARLYIVAGHDFDTGGYKKNSRKLLTLTWKWPPRVRSTRTPFNSACSSAAKWILSHISGVGAGAAENDWPL